MTRLSVCAACGRHGRGDACPFCGGVLEAAPVGTIRPRRRVARALLVASSLSALASTACGADTTTESGSPTDAGEERDATLIAPYGISPELDGGVDEPDATLIAPYGISPQPDAGNGDAAIESGVTFAPPYGIAPPFPDAGDGG